MLLGNRQVDAGHILENIVYLELLRRGYEVYVGKIDTFEVDFVAQKSQEMIYYQVALSVHDEKSITERIAHASGNPGSLSENDSDDG